MSTFVLETGVPIPKRTAGRSGTKYPFAQMEVGDSFLVDTGVKAATIRSAVGAYLKRSAPEGVKFAVRGTDEGLRVWRTA